MPRHTVIDGRHFIAIWPSTPTNLHLLYICLMSATNSADMITIFLSDRVMTSATQRGRLSSSPTGVFIHVFFFICFLSSKEVTGEPHILKFSKTGTVSRIGADEKIQHAALGYLNRPAGQGFQDIDNSSLKLHAAAAFYPNGPCPTAELFDANIDPRQVEYQVVG